MIRAVFFDLFETLITEFVEGVRKVNRAARDYRQLIGLSHDEFRTEWNKRGERRMAGAFPDFFSRAAPARHSPASND